MLQFTNEADLDERIQKWKEQITPKFIEILGSVVSQNNSENQNQELGEKLREVNRAVLRFSMKQNLAK